jgi:transposase
MGRALSHDLRERVLQASKGGISARKCAQRFGVAASTAIRWIDRAAKGETEPRKPARRASRLDGHEAFIDAMIEDRKDITLDEMALRLADERDLKIGRSALSAWLRSRGWTFKKRPRMHWSRNVRAC